MAVATRTDIVQIELPTPFPVGPVNCFLLKRDPPVLIDAGLRTEECYAALVAALREQGYGVGDVGAIIVTHAHRDHVGLLGRLLAESNAKAYGHPLVQREGRPDPADVEARRQFYVDIMAEFGVPADAIEQANALYDRFREFSEPFELAHVVEDGGKALEFTAYFVPGHSASDTLFVDPEGGVSFVGDHILLNTMPNPLLRRPAPGGPRAKSLVEYQRSLERTRRLDLGVCYPGHGAPFDHGAELAERILSRLEERSGRILKLVLDGDSTPYAVSRRLFPKLPMKNLHLGLSIAVGHMEVLEERGQLRSETVDGVLHFYPAA